LFETLDIAWFWMFGGYAIGFVVVLYLVAVLYQHGIESEMNRMWYHC
jgi:hypothetical protein